MKKNIKMNLVVKINNKWENQFQKDLKVHRPREQIQIQKIFNKWHRKSPLLIHLLLNNKYLDQHLMLNLELQSKEEQLKQTTQQ